MTAVRIRLVGGPVSGEVVWIEQEQTSVRVHVRAKSPEPHRTYEYRREGDAMAFFGEILRGPDTRESNTGESR